jgi:hypothetical protein
VEASWGIRIQERSLSNFSARIWLSFVPWCTLGTGLHHIAWPQDTNTCDNGAHLAQPVCCNLLGAIDSQGSIQKAEQLTGPSQAWDKPKIKQTSARGDPTTHPGRVPTRWAPRCGPFPQVNNTVLPNYLNSNVAHSVFSTYQLDLRPALWCPLRTFSVSNMSFFGSGMRSKEAQL